VHWHCRFIFLATGISLSIARRVVNGIQDILNIIFIYLFLINTCNYKIMVRSTELNTIIGT
jgi:hypothetical protein